MDPSRSSRLRTTGNWLSLILLLLALGFGVPALGFVVTMALLPAFPWP
jgi:hypothetical protein